MAGMDRSLLMILAIIIVVGAVGFLTVMPEREAGGDLVTGNVVKEAPADPCASCQGTPVCAAKFGRVSNYENACVAQCEGARVIYDGVCERIPRA